MKLVYIRILKLKIVLTLLHIVIEIEREKCLRDVIKNWK